MRYIIMCGGTAFREYPPKPLKHVAGERLVNRTIRLLRENGVTDIAVSTNDDIFKQYVDVPLYKHENADWDCEGYRWLNAFYPMQTPVCYLFGDVFYSPEAIKTIVGTDTPYIQFFASTPPFSPMYAKPFAEPFAFKVNKTKEFRECINRTIQYDKEGCFSREAIAWELWQVIMCTPLNMIDYTNYVAINDYTVDIDNDEIKKFVERQIGYEV